MRVSDSMQVSGAVYTHTNEPSNRVIAFRRAADGALTLQARHETGGAGSGEPYLDSQGSVVLTGDGRHLLVVNAASDEVSVFAVEGDGGLEFVEKTSVGPAPKSAAEHDGLVYVLNTAEPSVSGYRVVEGGLEPIAGAERRLPMPNAGPAQVGFSPDGRTLVVTERDADSIVAYAVDADGHRESLGCNRHLARHPMGLPSRAAGSSWSPRPSEHRRATAAASSYNLVGSSLTPVTESVPNGRSEICWQGRQADGDEPDRQRAARQDRPRTARVGRRRSPSRLGLLGGRGRSRWRRVRSRGRRLQTRSVGRLPR